MRKRLISAIILASWCLSITSSVYACEVNMEPTETQTEYLFKEPETLPELYLVEEPEEETEEEVAEEEVEVEDTLTEEQKQLQELIERYAEDGSIDLLALVCMAEAEGESEYGQRLVIDTILNRVDSSDYPDTVSGVVYQKSQFSSMWNGRADRCNPSEKYRELVIEELESRTNSEVIYFTAGHYSSYGTPLFSEGNHYFCAK